MQYAQTSKRTAEHKAKFNLRGFYTQGQSSAAEPALHSGAGEAEPEDDGSVDFGFDFEILGFS